VLKRRGKRRGKHPHNELTDKEVRSAPVGRHADGNNLHLRVRKNGSRTWVVRVTVYGRRRDLYLGPYPLVSLAEARLEAIRIRLAIREGRDPGLEKAQAQGPTVREFYEVVTQSARTGWKTQATEDAWRRGFVHHVFPLIGDKPVAAVTLEDARQIVVPHWDGRGSKGYVLRQNLDRFFQCAIVEKYRSDNPAAAIRITLPKGNSSVNHRASLPYQQAPETFAEWQDLPGIKEPVRLAMLFLVLTAVRLSEATEATWAEMDLVNRTWQIPKERMKSGNGHTVPFSTQALEVVDRAAALKVDGPFVFGVVGRGGKVGPVSGHLLRSALKRLGRVDAVGRPIVPHGLRSTFRVWSIDVAHAQREVGEAALAHGESDETVKSYSRNAAPFDPRIQLMQMWADYVLPWTGRFGQG